MLKVYSKILLLLFLISTAIFNYGCSSSTSVSNSSGGGNVNKVQDVKILIRDQNGIPFNGAQIMLTNNATGQQFTVTATGAECLFNGVPTGNYTVTVPGYSTDSLFLAITSYSATYNCELDRAKVKNYTITVVDDDGAPVANTLLKFSFEGVSKVYTTGTDGVVNMVNAAAGIYTISNLNFENTQLTIKSGDTSGQITLVKVKTVLNIEIKDQTGKHYPGATAVIKMGSTQYTATETAGIFTFKNIGLGEYTLTLPNFSSESKQLNFNSASMNLTEFFARSSITSAQIRVITVPGGAFNAGTQVNFKQLSNGNIQTLTLDATSSTDISGLDCDKYEVEIVNDEVYLPATITLSNELSLYEVKIPLSKVTTFTVVDDRGLAFTPATFTLTNDDTSDVYTKQLSGTTVSLYGIPTGNYSVSLPNYSGDTHQVTIDDSNQNLLTGETFSRLNVSNVTFVTNITAQSTDNCVLVDYFGHTNGTPGSSIPLTYVNATGWNLPGNVAAGDGYYLMLTVNGNTVYVPANFALSTANSNQNYNVTLNGSLKIVSITLKAPDTTTVFDPAITVEVSMDNIAYTTCIADSTNQNYRYDAWIPYSINTMWVKVTANSAYNDIAAAQYPVPANDITINLTAASVTNPTFTIPFAYNPAYQCTLLHWIHYPDTDEQFQLTYVSSNVNTSTWQYIGSLPAGNKYSIIYNGNYSPYDGITIQKGVSSYVVSF